MSAISWLNPATLILKLIGLYQKYLRPLCPPSCRFEPGCSEYVKQAIAKYGLINGGLKGIIRISCCHPFSGKSGYDPLK
jgi:putative membrane protein insertion efficiency factor